MIITEEEKENAIKEAKEMYKKCTICGGDLGFYAYSLAIIYESFDLMNINYNNEWDYFKYNWDKYTEKDGYQFINPICCKCEDILRNNSSRHILMDFVKKKRGIK